MSWLPAERLRRLVYRPADVVAFVVSAGICQWWKNTVTDSFAPFIVIPVSVPPVSAPAEPVAAPPRAAVKFAKNNDFQSELRRRVDEYFASSALPRRDAPKMYLKTAIILGLFAASYVLLVFFAHTWWQALPLATLLGLTMAGIGFNIQHDGGHEGYSNKSWVNAIMARSLDLIGGSSYFWHYQHGVYHHTYVNITHEDNDIDFGMLARLSPHHKRYWFHRWQHLYVWPLYCFTAIKWQLIDDFMHLITGHMGKHKVPRPKGWDLVVFFAGKAIFFTLAFVVPLMFHSVWTVLLFVAITSSVLGVALAVVFQLAHAVEEAEFPLPEDGNMESAWAIHQVQTTVDFARSSRVAAWLLGGLNFQIEHHLLPRVCHVNYPALSKIVQDLCREFGVQYNAHETFLAGVVSHFRWLRQMGRPTMA